MIGKIVAPHGVRGDIRILPETEHPEQFLSLKYLLLPDGKKLTLTRTRFHKNLILAETEEVNSMDEANLLRGQSVSIYRKDLPPMAAGHYYVSDLIGMPVYDESGRRLGTFKDALKTGSADAYVISRERGEDILVAAISDNIKKIDLEERRMVVRLPEWEEDQ